MTLNRLNIALAIALLFVAVLLVELRTDNSLPNYQVILGDDMTYSPAYASFAANSNFANERTMQAPVPGTIARGSQQFHFEPTPQDALRAGDELANPFDMNTEEGSASAGRGAVTFQTYCVSCHGSNGSGNGPVAQRGFPPPPSLLTGKSREMKDGQLFHILTVGQNSMPNFAAQLPPERRWDVINHIRSLQQEAPSVEASPSTPPAATEPETTPDPEASQTTEQESDAPVETDTE